MSCSISIKQKVGQLGNPELHGRANLFETHGLRKFCHNMTPFRKKKEYICFPHAFNYSVPLSLTLLFILSWKCRRIRRSIMFTSEHFFIKWKIISNYIFVKCKSKDSTFMHMPFDAIIFLLLFVTLAGITKFSWGLCRGQAMWLSWGYLWDWDLRLEFFLPLWDASKPHEAHLPRGTYSIRPVRGKSVFLPIHGVLNHNCCPMLWQSFS